MNPKTSLGQLRILSILEGISYLLLGLTMWLKYAHEMGLPNKIVGMIHGVLFVAFVIWVFIVGIKQKWGFKYYLIFALASILPLGTFIADWKYLKPIETE